MKISSAKMAAILSRPQQCVKLCWALLWLGIGHFHPYFSGSPHWHWGQPPYDFLPYDFLCPSEVNLKTSGMNRLYSTTIKCTAKWCAYFVGCTNVYRIVHLQNGYPAGPPQGIRSDCSVSSLTDTTRDNTAILSCDLEKVSDIGARPQPRCQIATGVTKRMHMHDLQQMC